MGILIAIQVHAQDPEHPIAVLGTHACRGSGYTYAQNNTARSVYYNTWLNSKSTGSALTGLNDARQLDGTRNGYESGKSADPRVLFRGWFLQTARALSAQMKEVIDLFFNPFPLNPLRNASIEQQARGWKSTSSTE